MCLLRILGVVAAHSHLSQGYLTPSCLLSICTLNSSIIILFTRIFHSFMFMLFMSSKMTCCICSVLTFITRISHFFMFKLNMLSEITYCRSSELTIITKISNSFMFNLNMSSKTLWCSDSVLTFITRISPSSYFPLFSLWLRQQRILFLVYYLT